MDYRIINRWQCWIRGLWLNLDPWINMSAPQGAKIVGHPYTEQKDGSLICNVCGHKA